MSIKLEHLIDFSNGCTYIQLNPILGLVVADKSMCLKGYLKCVLGFILSCVYFGYAEESGCHFPF
jgi:hypothetical protein